MSHFSLEAKNVTYPLLGVVVARQVRVDDAKVDGLLDSPGNLRQRQKVVGASLRRRHEAVLKNGRQTAAQKRLAVLRAVRRHQA